VISRFSRTRVIAAPARHVGLHRAQLTPPIRQRLGPGALELVDQP
jgi:hypothetical protein